MDVTVGAVVVAALATIAGGTTMRRTAPAPSRPDHALHPRRRVPLGTILSFVTLAGRRFHDQLDRGWLRPAVLVFAALAAATVLVDALT